LDKKKLHEFVAQINNFNGIRHPPKILWLGFYLQNNENFEFFTVKEIANCYDELDIKKPKNLSDFLNKLKDAGKLIPKKSGFRVVKHEAELIQSSLDNNSITSERLEKVYSPGNSYEFYDDVKKIIESSTSQVFLIVPYATEDIINLFLKQLTKDIKITLLTNKPQGNFVSIAQKFKSERGKNFSVKTNKNCHDRVFFVDKKCYVTGQSLDKAASKQPTYICKVQDSGSFRNVFQQLFDSGKTLI